MTTATIGDAARARLGRWPYRPDVAHLVLLDHQMVPDTATIGRWVAEARHTGATTVRTGAMFPRATLAFQTAGFTPIDTLVLLDTTLVPGRRRTPGPRRPTHRLRSSMVGAAAAIDRAAFGDAWGNDEQSLVDVMSATPRHRARVIGDLDGFAISGHAGATGYLQRLAVHPDARRRGHARTLVVDALDWMRRRGATTAMVNTAQDNEAALALYDSVGFRRRSDHLVILELALD